MRRLLLIGTTIAAMALAPFVSAQRITEKLGPQLSGFFDVQDFSLVDDGIGNIGRFSCMVSASTQPSEYDGNMLADCDGEGFHPETTIAVNPNNASHAVTAYHSAVVHYNGSAAVVRIVNAPAFTTDGGVTWREVLPPITPYEFSGDPALTFNTSGHVFLAGIAAHSSGRGPSTNFDAIVQRSLDGGRTWSNPVTLARGFGAEILGDPVGPGAFNDKEFIAADQDLHSPFRDRLYVSWGLFTFFVTRQETVSSNSRIQLSLSDTGADWSEPQTISGFSPACSYHDPEQPFEPNECDQDGDSYPTVAPGGRVYVSYANYNTPAENQVLVVRSDNGGTGWSIPVKAADVFDINYPRNFQGRNTLTGCQLRYSPVANSVADPTDPTGNTVYVALADNRNGNAATTNTDVFLTKSTDGGQTWSLIQVDTSPNDQFYPFAAVGPDGTVSVGYMDREYGNPANPNDQSICKYGFTLTTVDSHGNIVSSERVDTALSHADESYWYSRRSDPRTWFVGDYNGVAVGADGVTWSVWTDLRKKVSPLTPEDIAQKRTHGMHAVAVTRP